VCLIAVQNKFTELGEVLEDNEVVLQYAFGCQPEYMVAYQSLRRDDKNEIVTMYMILMEMSGLYQNITWSQENKHDQDIALLGNKSKKGKKFGYKFMANLCGKAGHKAYACWEDLENESRRPKIGRIQPEVVEVALVSYIDYCSFERFPCEGFCLVVRNRWLTGLISINGQNVTVVMRFLWLTKKTNDLIGFSDLNYATDYKQAKRHVIPSIHGGLLCFGKEQTDGLCYAVPY
jgi:hypothetical protein